MPPELDLIERLCVADQSLHDALHGSIYAFGADLPRAQRAIHAMISDGLMELYIADSDDSHTVPAHRLRTILQDRTSWRPETPYRLRITEAGIRREFGPC